MQGAEPRPQKTMASDGGPQQAYGVPKWMYERSDGAWFDMAPWEIRLLEKARDEGNTVCSYVWSEQDEHGGMGCVEYELDLNRMVQTNKATGTERRIRRVVDSGGIRET